MACSIGHGSIYGSCYHTKLLAVQSNSPNPQRPSSCLCSHLALSRPASIKYFTIHVLSQLPSSAPLLLYSLESPTILKSTRLNKIHECQVLLATLLFHIFANQQHQQRRLSSEPNSNIFHHLRSLKIKSGNYGLREWVGEMGFCYYLLSFAVCGTERKAEIACKRRIAVRKECETAGNGLHGWVDGQLGLGLCLCVHYRCYLIQIFLTTDKTSST